MCFSVILSQSMSHKKARGRPSVTEYSPFDPEKDADVLRKAMKGLGMISSLKVLIVLTRNKGCRGIQTSTCWAKVVLGFDKSLELVCLEIWYIETTC